LDLTIEAVRAVRAWFSGPIVLLADGAYNNASLLLPLRDVGIEMVSRLRSDARLRSTKIPRRPKGKRGRNARYGPRLASLATLARARSAFREIRVAIYGKTVTLLVREIEAYWMPVRAVVKVVITRDPKNPRRVAFLMTTDLARTAQAVVEEFGHRWTVEQLLSVLKVQLGLDSAEVRQEKSVRRHAALTLALATWLEIWAWQKSTLLRARSFATKLAALRQEVVTRALFESTPRTTRSRRIAKGVASLFATATGAR
jgi:hypothetical protein